MTTLEELTRLAVTASRDAEAQRRQVVEEAKQQREQEAEAKLKHSMEEFLSPEFLDSVELTYLHEYKDNRKRHQVSAYFPYLDLNWHIQRDDTHSFQVYNTSGTPYHWAGSVASYIKEQDLQFQLLLAMGKRQQLLEERAAEDARKETQYQERDRKAKAAEAQRKVEQEEWREKATAEHERLRTLFDEEKAKRVANLWQWLPGVTIEVYELEYCRGAIREDDETSFDYAGGWTAVSSLDEQGRITLQATMPYESLREAKTIQLVPEVHKPVWTVHCYSSTEELPALLRHEVKLELEHVIARRDSDMPQGIRLEHQESLGYDSYGYPEHWYSEVIGEKPLAWIRTLVQQAAREE